MNNIPKISALAYEAARIKTETPTLEELAQTLRQLKRSNLWLYNSIMNSIDSTLDKLSNHFKTLDNKTVIDIKRELVWNSLQVLDLIDRVLFEKYIQDKMEVNTDSSNEDEQDDSISGKINTVTPTICT